MTGPFDAVIAFAVAGLLNLFIAARVHSSFASVEGRFLRRTYLQTLALRCAGAVALNVLANNAQFAAYFWGDSGTYDLGGYHLALRWSGDIIASPYKVSAVSGYGFIEFVGLLYYVFGRNQLLVQFVNATIGSLAVVVIYAIARRLFDEKVARWAALFMAFFPQMIFWSCAMYKDPAIQLCIATSIYAVLTLRERLTARHLLLFVGATLALMTLRFYVFYMVVFATLGTFLFSQRRGLFSGLLAQVLLGGVFATAIVFGVRQETIQQQTAYFDLDRIQNARLGQTMLGQSDFGSDFDVSTPGGRPRSRTGWPRLSAVRSVPVGDYRGSGSSSRSRRCLSGMHSCRRSGVACDTLYATASVPSCLSSPSRPSSPPLTLSSRATWARRIASAPRSRCSSSSSWGWASS